MTLLKLAALTGLVLLASLGLICFEAATTTFTSGTAARPITATRPAAAPHPISPGIIDARSALSNTSAYTTYLPLSVNQLGSQRLFPDTTNGIFVFNDQLATWDMSEAQFQFAATHYVGTQKVLRDDARHLRQYNPNFLVLHYRLGQALGHSEANAACQPTTNYLSIIDGNQWVQEWPGDANVQDQWFFKYAGSRVFSCSNGHYVVEYAGDFAISRQ